MANKFTKTITASPGTEGVYHMGMRERYQRLTNLPSNWLKIRLGVFFSFTDSTGDNVALATEEVMAASTDPANRFLIGMSNGTAFPGLPGNKFLGMDATRTSEAVAVSLYTSNWYLSTGAGAYYFHPNLAMWTGSAWSVSASSVNQQFYHGTPAGLTTYCMGLVLDLDVRTANTGWLQYNIWNSASSAWDADMMGSLLELNVTADANTTLTTGAWWDNSGSNPVALPYFFIYSPFTVNQLRIHNMGYLQLA